MKLFDVQKEPQGVSIKQVESWSTDLRKWVYITIAVLSFTCIFMCSKVSLCIAMYLFSYGKRCRTIENRPMQKYRCVFSYKLFERYILLCTFSKMF